MATEITIYVYENWSNKEPSLMGELFVSRAKDGETYSFSYDDDYLNNADKSIIIDPDLSFFSGRQYTPLGKRLFGIFSDSCPDRWGRLLMQRNESRIASQEDRRPRKLLESDYLLGVSDISRMGALRFKLEEDGPFVSEENTIPPWVDLRKLQAASLEFEKGEGDNIDKWLTELLIPGSSLGGARPKANVLSPKGDVLIAKFPSRNDDYDVGAWEKVANELALKCGIYAAESSVEKLSKLGSTYLSKRFDRKGTDRIHFESAMTLLGQVDGADADVGYLDLADFIRANGARPKEDLHELWRRIVFNMAVSNTDDHLRNHGFILTQKGWRLSPMYDVNPVPYGHNLSLNVSDAESDISLELAVSVADYFELHRDDAIKEARKIKRIVDDSWQGFAKKLAISNSELEYMRSAFGKI